MKILQIKKLILLCSLLLILNSCSKNDSIEPVPIQTADIYISGFETISNGSTTQIAKYWKNGDSIGLTTTLNDITGSANSITIDSNNNLYLVGQGFSSGVTEPKYWKNNTLYILPYPSIGGKAEKIAISGNDVYISGESNVTWQQYNAVYWKNGVMTALTNWTNGIHDSNTAGIAVAGNDVYVAGNEYYNYTSTAKYWKNGIEHNLSYGTSNTTATGIALMDNDVYVSGFANVGGVNIALFWKNDVAFNLSDGMHNAKAKDILIKGNDVYIVGYESNGTVQVAKYWKNGVSVNLSDGTTSKSASSISISGSDIYILGDDFAANNIHYWKNGILNNINTENTATPKSIFVKEN